MMSYREVVEKHGSISAAARELSISRTTFSRRLRKEEAGVMQTPLQDAVRKYGNPFRAARKLGIPQATFYKHLKKEREGKPASTKEPKRQKRSKSPGLSEQELLQRYDPTEKTRHLMQQIPALIKPGRFLRDYDIRRALGFGDARLFRELARDPDEGFIKYQFVMGNEVWWTDSKTKARMLGHYKAKEVPINV